MVVVVVPADPELGVGVAGMIVRAGGRPPLSLGELPERQELGRGILVLSARTDSRANRCSHRAPFRLTYLASSIDADPRRPYTETMPGAQNHDAIRKAASILGSLGARAGGLKGGPARAKKLTAERRKAIARKAAQARWAKAKGKKG